MLELAYPLRQNELGHPLTLVGIAFALLGVGSLLSRLPAGAWYQTERAGVQIAGSLAVFSLSSAILGSTDVWAAQACLAVVHGFAFGLITTTSEPILGAAFVLLGTTRALLRVTSATAVADQWTGGSSVGMASASTTPAWMPAQCWARRPPARFPAPLTSQPASGWWHWSCQRCTT
jgi:hypothetical protein